MSYIDNIGCSVDLDAFCPRHCPNEGSCDDEHDSIFEDDEVSCYPSTCSVCAEEIQGEDITHRYIAGECQFCGSIGNDDSDDDLDF